MKVYVLFYSARKGKKFYYRLLMFAAPLIGDPFTPCFSETKTNSVDPDQTPQNAASGHDLQFANSQQHSERKWIGPTDEVG